MFNGARLDAGTVQRSVFYAPHVHQMTDTHKRPADQSHNVRAICNQTSTPQQIQCK